MALTMSYGAVSLLFRKRHVVALVGYDRRSSFIGHFVGDRDDGGSARNDDGAVAFNENVVVVRLLTSDGNGGAVNGGFHRSHETALCNRAIETGKIDVHSRSAIADAYVVGSSGAGVGAGGVL